MLSCPKRLFSHLKGLLNEGAFFERNVLKVPYFTTFWFQIMLISHLCDAKKFHTPPRVLHFTRLKCGAYLIAPFTLKKNGHLSCAPARLHRPPQLLASMNSAPLLSLLLRRNLSQADCSTHLLLCHGTETKMGR